MWKPKALSPTVQGAAEKYPTPKIFGADFMNHFMYVNLA